MHAVTAGYLPNFDIIQLPNDQIGLVSLAGVYLQAEIFDPATGVGHSQILGSFSGHGARDVQALATADGGLAVSWRDMFGVQGAVLDAANHVTMAQGLAGDFLGVDASGHALTLADSGGTPHIQTYALSDGGLFWSA
jgi:hypothetical protein